MYTKGASLRGPPGGRLAGQSFITLTHQDEVEGGDGCQGQVPEPEEGEDLLGDDVRSEEAEVVLFGQASGASVLLPTH